MKMLPLDIKESVCTGPCGKLLPVEKFQRIYSRNFRHHQCNACRGKAYYKRELAKKEVYLSRKDRGLE